MSGKGYVRLDREIIELLAGHKNALALYCVFLANIRYSDEPTKTNGIEIKQGQWHRSFRLLAKDIGNRHGKGIKPLPIGTLQEAVSFLEANTLVRHYSIEGRTVWELITNEYDTEKQETKDIGHTLAVHKPYNTERKRIERDKKDPNSTSTNKSTGTIFNAPSSEMVREYCTERNNLIDAEYFCDFYQTRGWVLSNGKKMRDWKAAVRTWEKNNFRKPNGNGNGYHKPEPINPACYQQHLPTTDFKPEKISKEEARKIMVKYGF